MLLMIAFSVLSIACCAVMKIVLVRANTRLNASFEGTGRKPQLYTLWVTGSAPRLVQLRAYCEAI
jgi:hypothetical protein